MPTPSALDGTLYALETYIDGHLGIDVRDENGRYCPLSDADGKAITAALLAEQLEKTSLLFPVLAWTRTTQGSIMERETDQRDIERADAYIIHCTRSLPSAWWRHLRSSPGRPSWMRSAVIDKVISVDGGTYDDTGALICQRPPYETESLLRQLAEAGRLDLMKDIMTLIDDDDERVRGVDVASHCNSIIYTAIAYGHTGIVEYLLARAAADAPGNSAAMNAAARNNEALYVAIQRCHTAVVDALFAHQRRGTRGATGIAIPSSLHWHIAMMLDRQRNEDDAVLRHLARLCRDWVPGTAALPQWMRILLAIRFGPATRARKRARADRSLHAGGARVHVQLDGW
jgi:hypothetical protein